MDEQVEVPTSSISFSEAADEAIKLLRKNPEDITQNEKKRILASLSKLGEGLSSSDPDVFINCEKNLLQIVFHASSDSQKYEDRFWEYRGENQDIFVFALEVASKHLKDLFSPLSSEKSDEKTQKMQEAGLQLINLVARKDLNPAVQKNILSHYKDFLPKIVRGMLTGGNCFDRALLIYLSQYPGEFIMVQNLITSSLNELQREALNPIVGAFFEPEVLEQRKDFGEEISKVILQKFGFPPEHTEKLLNSWWKDLGSSELHGIQICENLKNIIELEQRVPGISSWLMRNFGIRHFGRYPIELLLDQYRNYDDKDSPWGVFLFPYYDYNATFHGESWMMRDLWEQFRQIKEKYGIQFRIRIVETGNIFMEGKHLARLCKTYKPMSFAVVGAHGCSEGIAFGEVKKEGDWLLTHRLYSEGGISRAIRKFIQPGAPVVLSSCETGKGEVSPKHALQLLGFHAFGPDRVTYGVGRINADFSSGKLTFSVVFKGLFGA